MGPLGKATTQWQDYEGTIALDGEGPASTFLLDEANLDSEEWAVVGFDFFGAEHSQFTTLYVVQRSNSRSTTASRGWPMTKMAVPVVAYELPSDRAVKALTSAFKQWQFRATYKGVPVDVKEERTARTP